MVIALVNWVQVARIIYTETRALAERDFIVAERSLGAGAPRILFRHILPHLVPTVIVWGTLGIATTVLLEATLSFLGIGVQPPTALLGQHHLREPDLFPGRALAGVLPGAGDPARWRCPSIWSATRCATFSTRPSGGAADAAYLGRRAACSRC